MFRYKCVVSYDGTNYMGFQIQDDLPTIELSITNALKKLLDLDVKIYASGRTDRYVHARNQVFHFDIENKLPEIGILKGLNSYLPKDIHIKSVEIVDEDFHSRFSVKSKEYRYYINTGEYDPLTANYSMHITNLDVSKMQSAIKRFEGVHDFKGFASASIDPRKSTVKEIYSATVRMRGDYIEISFIGSSFLKYQVRRMVGALIEVARGKEKEEFITMVIESKNPKISHRVADGCGLYLYQVNY